MWCHLRDTGWAAAITEIEGIAPQARARARREHEGTTVSRNPTYTLDIVGYTDATGSDRDNANLSWQRVEVVRRRLTERGAVSI